MKNVYTGVSQNHSSNECSQTLSLSCIVQVQFVWDESDHCCIIREHSDFVTEVGGCAFICVEGVEEQAEHTTLWWTVIEAESSGGVGNHVDPLGGTWKKVK